MDKTILMARHLITTILKVNRITRQNIRVNIEYHNSII